MKEADVLSVTRRVGEVIRIGDDITVTVLAIKGSQARIGIAAPGSVSVHREEVYVRLRNGEAERGSPRRL